MVQWLIAALVGGFLVLLVVGGLTGRVRARGCCAPDPGKDLRMRTGDTSDTSGTDESVNGR